jgi:uncharacterized protein YkwD
MSFRPTARHRAARHRATRRRRRNLGVLCAVLLIPVTALAAVYVARSAGVTRTGLTRASDPQASHARAGHAASPAAQTVSTAGPPGAHLSAGPARAPGRGHRSGRPRATASPSPTPSPGPGSGPSPSPSPRASAPPSRPLTVANQVLALINQARAQFGLPPYSLSPGLDRSAGAHNALMAAGCGLAHQCPGEPPLGTRETNAGVTWTSAGENIGEGGPVPDTTVAIAQMALGLTQDMLNEKPPDDGHRLNILSSSFQIIGIAVYRDSSGTVWMTQDFAN